WFEGFHRPIELHGRLRDGCVPLVRTDTALELMLAHYGTIEASMFLERILENQPKLEKMFREEHRRIRERGWCIGFENDLVHNLALVAASFNLLSEVGES